MEKIVVFDIETYCPVEELDEKDIEYLEKRKDYQSKEKFIRDLSTNPYVSYTISFALYYLKEKRVKVFYLSEEENQKGRTKFEHDIQVSYHPISIKANLLEAERELIERFWSEIKDVSKFISFHGKNFDRDFIRLRTIIHQLKPENFFSFLFSEHIDLKEDLRVGKENFSLAFIARKLNIPFNKDDMDGSKVRELFIKKEYEKIAQYNAKDVIITGFLYERIRDYIHGEYISKLCENLNISELLEHALNKGLMTKKEVSSLINVYTKYHTDPPTENQERYLRELLRESQPPIYKIYNCLEKNTWNEIINSFNELPEEEIT